MVRGVRGGGSGRVGSVILAGKALKALQLSWRSDVRFFRLQKILVVWEYLVKFFFWIELRLQDGFVIFIRRRRSGPRR